MPRGSENSQGILAFPVPLPETPQTACPTPDTACSDQIEPVLACEDNLSFMGRISDGHVKTCSHFATIQHRQGLRRQADPRQLCGVAGACHPGMCAGIEPRGVYLLAGWQLRRWRRNCSPGRCLVPAFSGRGALNCAIVLCGTLATGCTADGDCRGATRRSTGGQRATAIPGTWIPFGFPPSIRANDISRDPTSENSQEIQRARIQVTCGNFPMSKATTRKRLFIRVNFRWSWSSVWFFP